MKETGEGRWTTRHGLTVAAHDILRQMKGYMDEAMEAWRCGDIKLTRNRLEALGCNLGEFDARLERMDALPGGNEVAADRKVGP